MAFSLAAKIHCGLYWLRKASLGLQRVNVYKTAAVGARVHRKLSRQGTGDNLFLLARISTTMLSSSARSIASVLLTVKPIVATPLARSHPSEIAFCDVQRSARPTKELPDLTQVSASPRHRADVASMA